MTQEPPPTPNNDSEAGFTLVELLVGLVLLSLLTSLMLGSSRFALSTWTIGTERGERLAHILSVQTLLRQIISEAYPYYVANDATHSRVAFDGTKTELYFLSSTPMSLNSSGRAKYSLFTKSVDGLRSLSLSGTRELSAVDTSRPSSATLLIDRADSIEFSYYGRLISDQTAEWHDRWQRQPFLPMLVRLRLRIAGRDWPDIVVAPRVNVDVGCSYDLLSKSCKGR